MDQCAVGSVSRVIVGRIGPGRDVLEAIYEIIERQRVEQGLVVCGFGSLRKATVRNTMRIPERGVPCNDDKKESCVVGPMQLLSTQGTVSRRDGRPYVHAHVVISFPREDRILSGNLQEGCETWLTVEVAIAEIKGFQMITRFCQDAGGEELVFEGPNPGR